MNQLRLRMLWVYPIGTTLANAEEQLICETLQECDGDKQKAAQMLGVSERTLYRHVPRPGQ